MSRYQVIEVSFSAHQVPELIYFYKSSLDKDGLDIEIDKATGSNILSRNVSAISFWQEGNISLRLYRSTIIGPDWQFVPV